MKQVLLKSSKIIVEELPSPAVNPGWLLVKNYFSFISTGTEMAGITRPTSPVQMVLQKPEMIKVGIEAVKNFGVKETLQRAKGEFGIGSALGYSCAGEVFEVGEGVADFQPGDLVACAGSGLANHAEMVAIPKNLAVKLELDKTADKLNQLKLGSTVAVGGIALWSVKRAGVELGDRVLIVGLGLLGQLIAQLCKLSGAVVMGCDPKNHRCNIAERIGIDRVIRMSKEDPINAVLDFTQGKGADYTIIAASAKNEEPLTLALQATRKKGKIVVVGDLKLDVKREIFYPKEQDLLISTSYGPGRYDQDYELKGLDYPYAYVRWTENRVMAEYLRLLLNGQLSLKEMEIKEYPVEQAAKAYETLKGSESAFSAFLAYPLESSEQKPTRIMEGGFEMGNPSHRTGNKPLTIAFVGAGGFGKAVHLGNLKKNQDFQLKTIVSRNPLNATDTARNYQARVATTSYQEALNDPDIDAVFISTRHNLHASQAISAIKAGKPVFLEKPMALNAQEIKDILAALQENPVHFFVGFNRRFSPLSVMAKEILNPKQPMLIIYRVNAGKLPGDHWTKTAEGGGRVIGEACHMFDLFNYFTENDAVEIKAVPLGNPVSLEDFSSSLVYQNGSLCTLHYFTVGAKDLPKEYIEIHQGQNSIIIDDFKSARFYGNCLQSKLMSRRLVQLPKQNKGHAEELAAFADQLRGKQSGLTLKEIISATRVSFLVDEQLKKGASFR